MKKMNLVLILLVFAVLACNSVSAKDPANDDEKALLKAATPIVEKLMEAMEKKDFALYKEPWEPSIAATLTRKDFEAASDLINNQLGKLESKKFYDYQVYKGYDVIHWKAVFSNAKDKDLYLRLVVKETGGKYQVAGFFIKTSPDLTK
ncbi:MAG: hypothetical protein ACLFQV_06250 [Vulcanimicrobiota bacterium]